MLKMKHCLAALLVVLAAAFASLPASAMLPAAPETPEATASEAPEQVIGDTQEAGSDARIANRIRGIFGELPAFENVSVDVQQGVVSLAGAVPAQEDIARAETIVGRISGVVTVENAIERAVVLCTDDEIDASLLPSTGKESRPGDGVGLMIPGITMSELERMAIEKTLDAVNGSTAKAAEILGISRRKIQYRLREWAEQDLG